MNEEKTNENKYKEFEEKKIKDLVKNGNNVFNKLMEECNEENLIGDFKLADQEAACLEENEKQHIKYIIFSVYKLSEGCFALVDKEDSANNRITSSIQSVLDRDTSKSIIRAYGGITMMKSEDESELSYFFIDKHINDIKKQRRLLTINSNGNMNIDNKEFFYGENEVENSELTNYATNTPLDFLIKLQETYANPSLTETQGIVNPKDEMEKISKLTEKIKPKNSLENLQIKMLASLLAEKEKKHKEENAEKDEKAKELEIKISEKDESIEKLTKQLKEKDEEINSLEKAQEYMTKLYEKLKQEFEDYLKKWEITLNETISQKDINKEQQDIIEQYEILISEIEEKAKNPGFFKGRIFKEIVHRINVVRNRIQKGLPVRTAKNNVETKKNKPANDSEFKFNIVGNKNRNGEDKQTEKTHADD